MSLKENDILEEALIEQTAGMSDDELDQELTKAGINTYGLKNVELAKAWVKMKMEEN